MGGMSTDALVQPTVTGSTATVRMLLAVGQVYAKAHFRTMLSFAKRTSTCMGSAARVALVQSPGIGCVNP